MSENSELHVIFGSGPVGRAVIDELLTKGKRVRLVKRSGQAVGLSDGVEVVAGDATDSNSTRAVCEGATVVYSCTNAPDYHKWPEQFPPLQHGVLEGAAANNAKLVVMENLYMYGPHGGQPMTEDMPFKATGPRGLTRANLARELLEAHASGKVRVAAGRASDFFGPRVGQSAMGEGQFRAAIAGKGAQILVNADQPHSFTYMPDIAKALVILGERDEALGQAWHIPNPRTVTPREFITLICQETGQEPKLMVAAPWMVQLFGLFTPPIRGISENFYQFAEPFIVNHSKFTDAFGDIATPLEDAIKTTAQWYRDNPPVAH